MQKTSDITVVETRALPSPAALLAELPKTEVQAEFVTRTRREIHRLIFTDDHRFLLIIGPCSIHDLEAGRAYARQLAALKMKSPIASSLSCGFILKNPAPRWAGKGS